MRQPPHRKVTALLAAIVWRLEAIKAMFNGKDPMLTKETAKTAQSKVYFENNKFLSYAPNFQYTPVKDSIKRICAELKMKHHL